MEAWSEWVLTHDLPALPDEVEPDMSVPIARWIGPRFASVLHLQWFPDWNPPGKRDRDTLGPWHEDYVRVSGQWKGVGGGGDGGWFDPPLIRPATIEPHSVRLSSPSADGDSGGSDDYHCWRLFGVAGSAIEWVEVIDRDGSSRQPIESPLGVFIACGDHTQLATITLLDRDGDIVDHRTIDPSDESG